MKTPLIFILTLLAAQSANGQLREPDKSRRQPEALARTVTGAPNSTKININNMTAWMRYDGLSAHAPSGDNGVYFPKWTGNVIYQDGFVFGSILYSDSAHSIPAPQQRIRVGGGTYSVGTQGGWVNGTGANATQEPLSNPAVRIYRIRRDYYDLYRTKGYAGFGDDAAEFFETAPGSASEQQMKSVFDQYATDWSVWPVNRGAPYIERNGISGYQPPPAFSDTFTADSLIAGRYDEPGLAGVNTDFPANQVVWTIFNDLNSTQSQGFTGSLPTGLEIQKTVWAYKTGGQIDDMYFTRFRLINKGQFWIDSMFVGLWSDPDLGSFSDDIIGCDSVLQMGFAYNATNNDATFRKYDLPPPAVAYVLLQGALANAGLSESGYVGFRNVVGKKNLPMNSFIFQSAGIPFDPCLYYQCDAGKWWKLLRGFAALGDLFTPDQPFFNEYGQPTKFPLSGDPFLGTGDLDGLGNNISFAPGDRRMMINTGPFQISPGDTQELIYATVCALGADRRYSVAGVKYLARYAHNIALNLFDIPTGPAPPIAHATGLDREIILEWGSDLDRVAKTETTVLAGAYHFEGYNLFQLPFADSPRKDWVRIATFDRQNEFTAIVENIFDPQSGLLLPVLLQKGDNTGISRSIQLKHNYLVNTTQNPRVPLNNGQRYYYALTAYNYQSTTPGLPASLESDPAFVTVQPKAAFGETYSERYLDTLKVTHADGTSDGWARATVVNPALGSGDMFEVRFDSSARWSLRNVSRNSEILANQNPSMIDEDALIVEGGIRLEVSNPVKGFKAIKVIADGNGPFTDDYCSFLFPSVYLNPQTIAPTCFNKGNARWFFWADSADNLPPSDEASAASVFRVLTNNDRNWDRIGDQDYEIRFTPAGGKAFLIDSGTTVGGVVVDVPFELWRTGNNTSDDLTDDVRLLPFVFDINRDGKFGLDGFDHRVSGSNNDPETDWFSWVLPNDESAGESGYLGLVALILSNQSNYDRVSGTRGHVFDRMKFVNFNGGSVSDPTFPANIIQQVPETGTIFRIITFKPNEPNDRFTYTVPAPDRSAENTKASLNRVGVFPNPYFAGYSQQNGTQRFVTFNNLPPRATIRIFNLAGHLVRTVKKDDTSQFVEWDLMNEESRPAASGIYICHVELPDLGTSRILKLAIIQPQLFPTAEDPGLYFRK